LVPSAPTRFIASPESKEAPETVNTCVAVSARRTLTGETLSIEGGDGALRALHPDAIYASMNPIVELYRIVPRGAYVGLWAVVPPPNDIPPVPVDSKRPETISSASDEILTVPPIPLCCVQ
tara:strand:- start:3 stop:365 length:363 start_codon:yes stop_codon:yes gene_type:complete